MAERTRCLNFKSGWFVIMFINFVFGISGMTVTTLKLKYSDKEVQMGFFKISMIFAVSNLILSVFLLAAVIKDSQKCAFLYALLSFLNLFTATIYIESTTTANLTFIVIFSTCAFISMIWFCLYGAYQIFVRDTLQVSTHIGSPV